MIKKVDMNIFLHFLLVSKQMNDFTVSEAKDTLMYEHKDFTDDVEARKFIYRQLTRTVKKGLLKRTTKLDEGVKKVIYSKTKKFLAATISPIVRGSKAKEIMARSTQPKIEKNVDYQGELKKELFEYEIDLNTILEEAKEYKRLSVRFPKLQGQLQQHNTRAKEKSIKLLGKINALQNLLGYTVIGHKPC